MTVAGVNDKRPDVVLYVNGVALGVLERHHTDRFRELMDRLMPRWRQWRDDLNRAPLAHEDWSY